MLSVTPGKNCCIIKSMSSFIEFISLNIQTDMIMHIKLFKFLLSLEELQSFIQMKNSFCAPAFA